MSRAGAALATFACLVITALGCRESGDGVDGSPATAAIEADTVDEGSGREASAPAPFPPLPGEGPPRTFELRLVNLREIGAVVSARAGAERVVVDTVPALDSVVVHLRVRADWVELDAVGPDGEELAGGRLDLRPDSLNRWTIPAVSENAAGALTAASGRSRSLVRVPDRDYPRASSGARAAAARAPTRGRSPREMTRALRRRPCR